jgi:streptogramin lyase
MNGRRRSWLGFLVVVTMAGVLASAGTASSSPASSAKPGRIQEFAVPTPDAGLIGIAAGADGNIWFAEDFVGKIGRITPEGVVTEYPVPKGAHAWNMAPGPDGNVWFTTDNKYVGRVSPSGHVRLFNISSLQHQSPFTYDIAAGGDGAMWFTGLNGIARITTDGSQMSLFPLPPGVAALRITEGPGGDLWFAGGATDRVGRMRVNGNVKTFAVPGSVFLDAISSGPDGSVWFTDETNPSKIGEVTAAGQVHVFEFGGGNHGLQGIAQGPDGNLWVTETNTNNLGRVLPDGTGAQVPMRWPHSLTWRIALGADGAMWFTDGGRNQIGRITVAAAPAIALDPASGGPGDEITISGEHFGAFEKVRISFQSGAGSRLTMTRARTDANGSFEAVANVPPGVPPGPATIRARGVTSHISSSASFEVT